MIVGVGSLHYSIIKMYATSSIFKEVQLHHVSLEMFNFAICVHWPILPNIKSYYHMLKCHFLTDNFWLSVWEWLPTKTHRNICLSQKDQQLEFVRFLFLKMLHGKYRMCSRKENPHLILMLLLKHILLLLQPSIPTKFVS